MELVKDVRIVWDSSSLREIDEAKAEVMKFKALGYEILAPDGSLMDRFRPAFEEVLIKAKKVGKRVMKILGVSGDERLVWDKENGPEAKEAKAKFEEFIRKEYKAYSVDIAGKKNRKIEEFDVDAEEILMIPPTAKG